MSIQNIESLTCSVIVPVYNGAAIIIRCLDALADQSLSVEQYEIIVVDDGSTDETANCVHAWKKQNPTVRLGLIQQENAGPAAARNHGAKKANAPLLLFTDGDCAPASNWIEVMCSSYRNDEDGEQSTETQAVIGSKGAYLTAQTGLVPLFVQAEYEDRYDRMSGLSQIDFIDTYSAAYRRDIFLANDGFDAIFTTASVEDQELSFRLASKGYRLVFNPDARVYHIHDENIGEYWRRKYYIGYWKALLTQWHPERMVQDSHTPQVLKVQMVLWATILSLLPLALAGLVWTPLYWIWLAICFLFVGFLVSSMPFVGKLAERSWMLAFFGPLMLTVRSIALGLGYLQGTIHFSGTVHGQREAAIPGWKRIVKRLVDIVGALLGLIIALPIIAIAAIAIKLDSPGSIFYSQIRIGENGMPFRIVKLRSMVDGAEEQLSNLVDIDSLTEPVYKILDDPRVTKIGGILRRTSIDEAPQFYNVLKGEMSLVGPRPEDAHIVELYNDQQRRRLAVKPGMTGPMQVSGRGNLSLEERLNLELDYIENYSIMRDFKLIFSTFPALWKGDGAY